MLLSKKQARKIVTLIGYVARQRAAIQKAQDPRATLLNPIDFLAELAAKEFPPYSKYLLPHYGESDGVQKKIGTAPDDVYDITEEETTNGFQLTLKGTGNDYHSFGFWKEGEDEFSPFGSSTNID